MKPIQWLGEACDLPAEPATGTYVTRMTAAIMANLNIYGEQPYTTPDGRRIAILRSPYADPRMPPAELCVADLVTLRLAVIEENVLSILVATSGYSGVLLYLDGERRLMRVNLATLEREALFPWTLPEHVVFESATPDGRYLVGTVCEPDFPSASVRAHKYWAPIKRVDQVYGDRNFVCTCPPMDVWQVEHEGEKAAA